MKTSEMGRVVTEAKIENLEDLWAVRRGDATRDRVRRVELTDALADTRATLLSLPTGVIFSRWRRSE
jgi:hypothetical protein